jgi:NAD(P)-dependent dehydrogenase (short-subunit alcohol dehydrogenase family)
MLASEVDENVVCVMLLRFAYRCVSPPGYVLNTINAVLHKPIVAPLLLAIYWCLTCLLAVALTPLVFLDGLLKAWSDAIATELAVEDRSAMAVIVTGCDTGFGRALAIDLAERGLTVFACCLNHGAAGNMGKARSCKMDVTSDADVETVAADVRAWIAEAHASDPRRVLAVVNNAGVGTGGFVDWLSLQDYERDLAVNFMGVVRVCKAFLPLLRQSADAATALGPAVARPRILIVSSMSGKLPVPLLSSYSASKHAAAAFAACLRMEVENLWNVHVCTVLPSFHRTPLTQGGVSTVSRKWSGLAPSVKAMYGDACAQSCFEIARGMMDDWAWDPERVSEALARAVTQVRAPPAELTIGGDALFGLNALRHLPPAVYEAIIYHWYAWNLVMPSDAENAKGKLKKKI